jgi:hypothetical protein
VTDHAWKEISEEINEAGELKLLNMFITKKHKYKI